MKIRIVLTTSVISLLFFAIDNFGQVSISSNTARKWWNESIIYQIYPRVLRIVTEMGLEV